jgi:hypothetical protein
MVFPYLKGFDIIKSGSSILLLYSYYGDFLFSLWYLTSAIKKLSLVISVRIFLFLKIFLFF